jgi:hypothetical protein
MSRRRESNHSLALGNSFGITKTCVRSVVVSKVSALASRTISNRLDPTGSDPSDNRLTTECSGSLFQRGHAACPALREVGTSDHAPVIATFGDDAAPGGPAS